MTARTRPVARLRTIAAPDAQRRKKKRSPCNLDISFRKLDTPSNYFRMARVWDVSQTGVSLQLKEEIERGTVLEIEFLKGSRVTRVLLARVVHSTEHSAGTWIIGCDLDRILSEREVETLL